MRIIKIPLLIINFFLIFFLSEVSANEKIIKSINEKIKALGKYTEVENYPNGFFDLDIKIKKQKKFS